MQVINQRMRLNQDLNLSIYWMIAGLLMQRGRLLSLNLTMNNLLPIIKLRSLLDLSGTHKIKLITVELWRMSGTSQQTSYTLLDAGDIVNKNNNFLCDTANMLELTYRFKLRGLSRRMRKIVKNKYQYKMQYEWVYPAFRCKAGLRLIKPALELESAQSFKAKLHKIMVSLENKSNDDATLAIWYKHQYSTLDKLKPRLKSKH